MKQQESAQSIWDQRYQDGDLACTQESVAADPIDYTQHPFLYRLSTAQRITGDPEGNPLMEVAKQFLVPSAKKMLAVGSGLAFAEESLARGNFVEKVVAFEASEVAVTSARERFAIAGLADRIDIRCGDVMEAQLSDCEFDLVFVQAAIHHFYNIEEMFELFHRVLKPGGLIIYDEYVGPDHHMYEDHVMQTLDEINECLAPQFRHDVLRNSVREEVPSATLEWMMQMDPSEGVHASLILPLTYKFFDVVQRIDYGGTVMRPFFVGILPNFDFNDPKDQTIASLIIKMEELLVRNSVLPSYHTKIVGKKLEQPRKELSRENCARINYADWPGFSKYGPQTKVQGLAEFAPANHSDENWKFGVGVCGKPTMFLPATRKVFKEFRLGRCVRFSDQSIRKIESIHENAGSMIVNFTGTALDPLVAGFPNRFRLIDC
jgi:SAM-dependent methyltransferase